MDMKVYDRNLAGTAAAGLGGTEDTQKVSSSSSGGAQSTTQTTAGDQVQFSGTLGRLSQALSTQGSERASRVAALTAAYQSGNYQPNPVGTARGMISEAMSGSQSA